MAVSAAKRFAIASLHLSILGLTLGCGMIAPESNVDSNSIRRDNLPIVYYLSKEVSGTAADEIHAAFRQWESDLNAPIFRYGGVMNLDDSDIGNDHHPMKNVIFTTNRSGKIEPPYGDGFDAIARTFVYGASKIHDTDVVLYEYDKNYVDGRDGEGDIYSVKTVMMHEIGRMLFGNRGGDDEESVLNNPVYPKGHVDEKTVLSTGDIALFYALYGDLL